MSTDLIRYDLLVQNALKGVVRNVLTDAARDGLPGDHHFCITFRTHAPGVKLSSRVKQQYPEELTIILQHQFWDLVVMDHAFEVGLSFGRIPERLTVPYESITGFWDPSVQFGLKFEIQDEAPQAGANDAAPAAGARPTVVPKASSADAPSEPVAAERAASDHEVSSAAPTAKASQETGEPDAGVEQRAAASEGKVVSIDAFRKKT
jgi:hypothetical protein